MNIRPLERPSDRVPSDGEAWTVLNLVLWSAHYLSEKGVENARLDAEHLLADVLETSRLELYLQHDRPLHAAELAAYKPRLKRRAQREPLQYILGRAAFRDLEIGVDTRALIPRPETEALVEAVLKWSGRRSGRELTALDLGTGSGAIAVALATEGNFGKIVATDASAGALALAAENLRAHEVTDAVELREGSLFDPLTSGERFDVVVSNPPYVTSGELAELQPEVRDWEPRLALDAGDDGLNVLGPLVSGAASHLTEGGLLALEVGSGQAGSIRERVIGTSAFTDVRIEVDLNGHERLVLADRIESSDSPPAARNETIRRG